MTNYYQLLTAIAQAAPNATVGVDMEGQIIIYTNLCESQGALIEMSDDTNGHAFSLALEGGE
jgi:hypothetical protein